MGISKIPRLHDIAKDHSMNNEQKLTIKTYPDIKEVTPPQEYINIWEDISLKVQANKAHTHNLSEAQTKQCFSELQRRPYYLSTIVQHFNVQNIAEVGTAEGLQFFTSSAAEDVKIYRVGNAASGNPNHQVIIRKRF